MGERERRTEKKRRHFDAYARAQKKEDGSPHKRTTYYREHLSRVLRRGMCLLGLQVLRERPLPGDEVRLHDPLPALNLSCVDTQRLCAADDEENTVDCTHGFHALGRLVWKAGRVPRQLW